nr:multicopper oxidase domain-containing protein [Micromonospora purpureochromogenes]
MHKKSSFPLRWLLPVVVVVLVIAGAGVIGVSLWPGRSSSDQSDTPVGPHDPAVVAAEAGRERPTAQVENVTLTAAPTTVRIGGRSVETWAFNGQVPGPEIKANKGDIVQAKVVNRLPQDLTVHWHGIAVRNDMDGVPDLTQATIKSGGEFTYRFAVADPGTFMYHSHVGTQLDRGLYGPLIVTDPADAAQRDVTVVLDDWLDGTGRTPDQAFAQLRSGNSGSGMPSSGSSDMGSMPGMSMPEASGSGSSGHSGSSGMDMGGMPSPDKPLGSDTADTTYPYYLINGRTPSDPVTVTAKPGERIRLRIINAASNTPFRVALGGGTLDVVASDGYPVQAVEAKSILVGMGERYDAVVTAPNSGAVPLVAAVEGAQGQAMAVLRTGPGIAPIADARPGELDGRPLTVADLHSTTAARLPARTPDQTATVDLTGDMSTYKWGVNVNGKANGTVQVRQGQRIRVVMNNTSMMWHPIHLHGHTFQVVNGDGTGPRKDTVSVPPMSKVTIELDADNPGQWALHCHNIYHAEAGMTAVLSYVK